MLRRRDRVHRISSNTDGRRRSKKSRHFPLANETDLSSLEFLVTSANDDYYDLNDHCLELKIKIVKRNAGEDILAADKVGHINFSLHSIFSQIAIHINGQLVSVASSTYPYMCLFRESTRSKKRSSQAGSMLKTRPVKWKIWRPTKL